MPTKLTDSGLFSDAFGIAGAGLDSSLARPTDSHLPVLAQKSAREAAHNPQPDVVVSIIGIVVVANRGTAVVRLIVPRTAAFWLPAPFIF